MCQFENKVRSWDICDILLQTVVSNLKVYKLFAWISSKLNSTKMI